MKKTTKWIIGALMMVVAAGSVYTVLRPNGTDGNIASAQPGGGETPVMPPVKADNKVMADGRVVPVRSAALSFSTSGVVSQVLVREGEQVKAGQVLVRLDSARQAASVAQAEAQLSRASARLQELMAGARPQEMTSAETALERAMANLTRIEVTGAPLEIATAQAEVRNAQAQLDLIKAGARPETIAAAQADVAAAQAALDGARVALAETELKAPFAGVIASLRINEGEFITPGNPVLRVVDTSAWQVLTEDLTELSVVKIKEGDNVVISFDAIPDLKLNGKVTSINPLGENRSGDITYAVTVTPARHEPKLRWNMTATVTIEPTE